MPLRYNAAIRRDRMSNSTRSAQASVMPLHAALLCGFSVSLFCCLILTTLLEKDFNEAHLQEATWIFICMCEFLQPVNSVS